MNLFLPPAAVNELMGCADAAGYGWAAVPLRRHPEGVAMWIARDSLACDRRSSGVYLSFSPRSLGLGSGIRLDRKGAKNAKNRTRHVPAIQLLQQTSVSVSALAFSKADTGSRRYGIRTSMGVPISQM